MKRVVTWKEVDGRFPAGTIPGDWLVTISGDANISQASAGSPFEIDLPAGSYVATVARLDSAGNVLGSDSKPFILSEPQVVVITIPGEVDVVE